ncbi:hypothetical protein VNI00_006727 [Paramarasmius palmivorus]|uniref:Uncharacterized protein n=1 Tax=Paramarasmius palmivorus TaxID=297713 RepID=A0AAW0D7G7_9AGAR
MSDNRSLLTNRTSSDLECCYLLPPEGDWEERLARYFTALGFSGDKEFKFESPENRLFLEASLREKWETYGIFCFVPPMDILDRWTKLLKAKNAEWKADSRRPAEVYETMTTDLKTHGLRVLVIHPMHLLAKGQNIQVAQRDDSLQKYYVSSDCRSHLVDRSGRELCINVSRGISPFPLLINPYSKIECLSEDELRQDGFGGSYMRMQKSMITELMKLVHWAPSGYEVHAPESPVDTKGKRRARGTGSAPDSGPDTARPKKKPDVDDSDGDSSSNHSKGGSLSHLHPDQLLPNGLTRRQHVIVGERVFDYSLPGDERIANVMMWFGMGRAPEEPPDFLQEESRRDPW